MKDFRFTIPQNIKFGVGVIKELPDLFKKEKYKKALLISDRGLEKAGLVKKITSVLDEGGIAYDTYLDVCANPTNVVVDEATKQFKSCGADVIIALGGGSSMDTAKGCAVLVTYGGHITDWEGPQDFDDKIVPIIAIPTTAGTGSEVTCAAVFTNVETNWKFSVRSERFLPKISLLDPEMITGLPPYVAATTGVDALVHAIESYTNIQSNVYTEAMCEKAMELLGGNIRKFVANRSDIEAASNMLLGSTLAGLAFSNNSLGNVHAMSHPVSGHFGVAHGAANAILLPAVLKYNELAADDKYEKIYNYIKKNKNVNEDFYDDMLYDEIYTMLIDLGIPTRLSEVGVTEDKFDVLAADAMKAGNIKVNPRSTKIEDVINIYKSAF